MTLAQVGGEDLSRSFLSLVETGRSRISLRALSIVAGRLDLPITYFLEGTGPDADTIAELALDGAESALHAGNARQALELLPDEVPDRLTWREEWLRGWALLELGQAKEAIPHIRAATELGEAEASPRDVVRALYGLGMALYRVSAYEEAHGYLERALARAQELDDLSLVGMITVALGHIAYTQGRFDRAMAAYDRARELFSAVRDPLNLASVYSGLSRVYERSGNSAAALRYSRLSLGIHEQRHNQREAARELAAIAERALKVGNTDDAIRDAQEAVELAHEANAPDVEVGAHAALAGAYLSRHDLPAAEAEIAAAEANKPAAGPLEQSELLLIRAGIAEERGDSDAADSYYKQAIKELKRIGHGGLLGQVALTYSKRLQERGDVQAALEYALLAAEARQIEPDAGSGK